MVALKNSYKFRNKMKKLVILIVFINVFHIGISQQAPPQGINYQAMVYVPYGNQLVGVNSAGQIPANTNQVLVKFTLEEGNNGPVIYEETHVDTTDQYGLLNSVIGTGTPTSNSPGLFKMNPKTIFIRKNLGELVYFHLFFLTKMSLEVRKPFTLWYL